MSVTFAVRGLAYRSARSFYRALKRIFKPAVQRHPGLHRFARALKEAVKDLISPRAEIYVGLPESLTSASSVPEAVLQSEHDPRLPKWLIDEWKEIHDIEPQLFPVRNIQFNIVTDFISPSKVGEHYLDLCELYGEDVSHVFLVPWLKKGGADLVTLNYVRALSNNGIGKKVVVITTENSDSIWAGKLPAGVRFIEFGKRYCNLSQQEQEMLLTRLFLQLPPRVIHNINSLLGYNIFIKYGKAIAEVSRLYACAFCEDITPEGRSVGYPVCFLPHCFDALSAVFSDNQHMIERLRAIFAFEQEKLFVHYQPITVETMNSDPGSKIKKDSLDILWASRLDIQKRPDILINIAKQCKTLPFTFHVYGSPVYGTSEQEVKSFVNSLKTLQNVRYYGPFDGLPSLPIERYDIFLYTSQWDGLPNVLLEAVSMGLPVVASAIGGIPELIQHGKTGFLVEPYDDIDAYVRILSDVFSDRTELGIIVRNAYELLDKRHSWSNFNGDLKAAPYYVDFDSPKAF